MVGEWDVRSGEHSAAVAPQATPDAGKALRYCPLCGGDKLGPWGHADSGVQRLRCGVCERTFNALHGTVLAGLHDLAAFRLVLDDMMDEVHSSCRALAARLGLDKSTVWRWRQRINAALAIGDRERVPWLADGDVVRLRESRKASREWVNHRHDPARFPAPDRPRWVDVDSGRLPPPTPPERYTVSVQLGVDGAGGGIARVLPTGASATPEEGIRPNSRGAQSASASAIVAGNPSDEPATWLAAKRGPAAAATVSSADDSALTSSASEYRAAHGLRDRFKAFIRPFRGPATRHLEGYAAWFTIGSDGSKERRLTRAWALLLRGRPTGFADIRRSRARTACA